MGAAFALLILAIIALAIFAVAYGARTVLFGVCWVIEKVVSFIQHEMLMRPKERYFIM